MGDNGHKQDVTTEKPRTMTVNIYPNGTVEVLGLPNNMRMAHEWLSAARLAMVTKFMEFASKGMIDEHGNYTGPDLSVVPNDNVLKFYLDMAAVDPYQALEEIEARDDRDSLKGFVHGIYADLHRSNDSEKQAYAAAFLSALSPDQGVKAEYWAARIAQRREELRA